MTAPVAIDLSFPFMCPLKSNAGCADSTRRGTREMTVPVVLELSFPFMCPHVALKSNAGCADSTTRGTREIDGGQCRSIRLARSFSIVSCPEQWTPTCRCLCSRLIKSALERYVIVFACQISLNQSRGELEFIK